MSAACPGLYVHVPFCSAICPYCDFAVRVDRGSARRAWVDALLLELEGLAIGKRQPEDAGTARAIGGLVAGEHGAFDTIYFGGGTPSLLGADVLERILEAIRDRLPVADDARLYLEANPEDVDESTVRAWKELDGGLGVHMLSLGIQSLDDDELRFLGRRHAAEEARRGVETALGAGLPTVSIDLIYGLPDQDADAWRRILDEAVALGPQHLSCYELEIHRRTTFGKMAARGDLQELPEDDQADLFRLTHERLRDHGYDGYEVSNFAAAPEHRSAHNAKYWRHVPYLGLGPSSHSYAGGIRWWNHRHAERWQRALRQGESAVEDAETLTPRDHAVEAIMLGLRTRDGVDLARIRDRWGVDVETPNASRIGEWSAAGWIEREGSVLRPTITGLAVADRLAAELEVRRA